jgi:hypothetical protein
VKHAAIIFWICTYITSIISEILLKIDTKFCIHTPIVQHMANVLLDDYLEFVCTHAPSFSDFPIEFFGVVFLTILLYANLELRSSILSALPSRSRVAPHSITLHNCRLVQWSSALDLFTGMGKILRFQNTKYKIQNTFKQN